MLVISYDHSFDGFLTAIFDLYAKYGYGRSEMPVKIVKRGEYIPDLFADLIDVATDINKAGRVSAKIEKLIGKDGFERLLWAFLSEDDEVENCLLGVITYAIKQPGRDILKNYAHPAVIQLTNLVRSVSRERHRMLAFVRFELMQDGLYFARIEPDFNVLPSIANHFRRRYQTQPWAIFDLRRQYGIYYDLKEIHLIDNLCPALSTEPESSQFFSEEELNYQKMWKGYFASVNIQERSNPRLHVQQLPKRYWRHLTEKRIVGG